MSYSSRKILFTGGGSSGHVTPNIALIEKCQQENWEVSYIGSKHGIEKQLISRIQIPYYSIASGKLRRYFSWQNFIDPFKIFFGIFQAFFLIRKIKPKFVFSKGGFVAVPVVLAAWFNRIPVIVHESDLTPGLANRLSFPFARKICLTFPPPSSRTGLPRRVPSRGTVRDPDRDVKLNNKIIITGAPIRSALLKGNREKGLELCAFTHEKPVVLVIGGGLGAENINQTVRTLLPELLEKYQIVHLCGEGKKVQESRVGYCAFEYLHESLADVFACADIVVSRAGANALCEIAVLRKPNLLIPLSVQASRGDQIANAKYFEALGLSEVIPDEDLRPNNPHFRKMFLDKLDRLLNDKAIISEKFLHLPFRNGTEVIYSLFELDAKAMN